MKCKILIFIMVCNFVRVYSQNYEIDKNIAVKEIILKESDDFLISKVEDYLINTKNDLFVATEKFLFKFNNKGVPVKKYFKNGAGPSEIKLIEKILLGNNNEIIVADRGNRKFIVLNSDLKFIREVRFKNLNHITSWCKYNNKYIVVYSIGSHEKPIYFYDLESLQLVKNFGKDNEELKKYQVMNSGGDIIEVKNQIYYIHSHDYKIYKIDENFNSQNILKTVPSHFNKVSKKENPNKIFTEFSVIQNLYSYSGKILIGSLLPSKNEQFPEYIFDMYDLNGELIYKNLKSKYLVQAKQFNQNTYIKVIDRREKYPEGDPKANLIFRIINLSMLDK